MRIGIVGCGFVADYYLATVPNHPELTVAGVTDRDRERARRFSAHHRVPLFETNADLLADPSIQLVVNLTNPDEHYVVSKAVLDAGKHVYTEKPLAMDMGQAEELVALAEERGLRIASAPCSVLGEAAQTVWKALRRNAIGRVYLAYAELDDGMVHRQGFRHWRSPSGLPWPYRDEFQVGCTLEHAGYYVTWLTAFFGPVRRITAFAAPLVADKGVDPPLEVAAPDFTAGCLEFASGVTARITTSIVAEHDHTLRIFGEDGVLTVENGWFFGSRIDLMTRGRRRMTRAEAVLRNLLRVPLPETRSRAYPPVHRADYPHRYDAGSSHQMDFARGVADLAEAIEAQRESHLPARFALHVNEIVLTLQNPTAMGSPRVMTTDFAPLEPMPWAQP